MKNIFFFVLICSSTSFAWGQSMPNSVMSAGGENIITTNNKIQFTIGETITLESSKTTLGFHSIFSKYLQVENHQYSNGDKVFPNPIVQILAGHIYAFPLNPSNNFIKLIQSSLAFVIFIIKNFILYIKIISYNYKNLTNFNI